jgi:hypothetical protein
MDEQHAAVAGAQVPAPDEFAWQPHGGDAVLIFVLVVLGQILVRRFLDWVQILFSELNYLFFFILLLNKIINLFVNLLIQFVFRPRRHRRRRRRWRPSWRRCSARHDGWTRSRRSCGGPRCSARSRRSRSSATDCTERSRKSSVLLDNPISLFLLRQLLAQVRLFTTTHDTRRTRTQT